MAGADTGAPDLVTIVCDATGGEMLAEDDAHAEYEYACVGGR